MVSSEITYTFISFVPQIYSVRVTVSSARCLLQHISCSVAELPAMSERTLPGLSTPGVSRAGCTKRKDELALLRERTALLFSPVCRDEVADICNAH